MKFILVLSGSMGASVLPRVMSAPPPFAVQWLELMPLAMNSTASRFGGTFACAGGASANAADVSAPNTDIDSSHGSAITTPAPYNIFRREIRSRRALLLSLMSSSLGHGP